MSCNETVQRIKKIENYQTMNIHLQCGSLADTQWVKSVSDWSTIRYF